MNNEFNFNIYSRRWGHGDNYSIKITDTGWNFSATATYASGDCNKKGYPFIFETLEHESINYPKELDGYLEWLWNQTTEQNLSKEEIQNAFNALSQWINLCEKNSPKGLWTSFK